MLKLKPEVIVKRYCVPIPMETFLKFLDKDKEFENDDFVAKLEKMGADKVDYEGFFGANLFFSLDLEYEDALGDIMAYIEEYMSGL